jgi:redox-regulated HSP33 family molecular chaperone
MQDYTPSVPLTREQVHQILSTLIVQSEQAESFISSGRLKVKVDESEFNANILLAGTKSPFRIKMEVTHRWGRPLFHILI